MKVRCGLMNASQAAEQLGISRKTYYKWEQRALSAMLEGLTDQPPGVLPAGGHAEAGPGKAAGGGSPGQRTTEAQNGTEGCADGLEIETRHGPGEKKMNALSRR